MFYKNILKGKRTNYKVINYATFENGINSDFDESLIPLTYAKNTYNFNYDNGSLKEGLGIEPLKLYKNASECTEERELIMPENDDVLGVWMLKGKLGFDKDLHNMLLIYTKEGYIYQTLMYAPTRIFSASGATYKTLPNGCNYYLNGKNVVIFTAPTEPMKILEFDKTGYRTCENIPNITSMCVHSERLFATVESVDNEKNEIWFSDDLDPTNFNVSLSEGGFIKLLDERGSLNRVVEFNNFVYIFRDFGITRLQAFGDQKEFSVSQIYLTSKRIIPSTICVCGGVILFCTKNSIYMFDGNNVSKLNVKIENMLNINLNTVSAFYNGKYYLATNLKFMGEQNKTEKNNALLEINLENGKINILKGVDIVNMKTINDDKISKLVLCVKNGAHYVLGQLNNSGLVFNKPTEKLWKSPLSDMGYPNLNKTIKEIYLKSVGNYEIEVETENGVKNFKVNSSNGITKVKINVTGKLISISFKSVSNKIIISNPKVVVALC